jgi:hypothetical protein
MPFTPYHLGPAIALGLPLRGTLHAPTLILCSVILDIEPLLVLLLGLPYLPHGYTHTLLLAIPIGLGSGYLMFRLEGALRPVYRVLSLEPEKRLNLASYFLAGALGTTLHVMLDSPLYDDIRPFFPLQANPLYDPSLSSLVYSISLWLGILGIVYWAFLFVASSKRSGPSRIDHP